MIDRGFSEVDLHLMMENATGLTEDEVPGRWVVETRHGGDSWHVIIEPDFADEVIVIITAYGVGRT